MKERGVPYYKTKNPIIKRKMFNNGVFVTCTSFMNIHFRFITGYPRIRQTVCERALWIVKSIIWSLRIIIPYYPFDFWNTTCISHSVYDGEVHIPGRKGEPTQISEKYDRSVGSTITKKSLSDRESNPQVFLGYATDSTTSDHRF